MWPSVEVIARAFKGQIAEVLNTPWGMGRGVRSELNHIYLVVGPKAMAWCEKCEQGEHVPKPPGSAPPGEPHNPLVAPGTKAHALFVLTWLHKFADQHEHREPSDETDRIGESGGEVES